MLYIEVQKIVKIVQNVNKVFYRTIHLQNKKNFIKLNKYVQRF